VHRTAAPNGVGIGHQRPAAARNPERSAAATPRRAAADVLHLGSSLRVQARRERKRLAFLPSSRSWVLRGCSTRLRPASSTTETEHLAGCARRLFGPAVATALRQMERGPAPLNARPKCVPAPGMYEPLNAFCPARICPKHRCGCRIAAARSGDPCSRKL